MSFGLVSQRIPFIFRVFIIKHTSEKGETDMTTLILLKWLKNVNIKNRKIIAVIQ